MNFLSLYHSSSPLALLKRDEFLWNFNRGVCFNSTRGFSDPRACPRRRMTTSLWRAVLRSVALHMILIGPFVQFIVSAREDHCTVLDRWQTTTAGPTSRTTFICCKSYFSAKCSNRAHCHEPSERRHAWNAGANQPDTTLDYRPEEYFCIEPYF